MAGTTQRDPRRTVSLAVFLVGVLLAGFMAWTEGEPGALPLALALAGAVGAFVWRKPRRH